MFLSQECINSILGRHGPVFLRTHLFYPDYINNDTSYKPAQLGTMPEDFIVIGDWNHAVSLEDIHGALEWYKSHQEVEEALVNRVQDIDAMYLGEFGVWHMVWQRDWSKIEMDASKYNK